MNDSKRSAPAMSAVGRIVRVVALVVLAVLLLFRLAIREAGDEDGETRAPSGAELRISGVESAAESLQPRASAAAPRVEPAAEPLAAVVVPPLAEDAASDAAALPEAEFFGTVTDAAGRGLAGAEVVLIVNNATRAARAESGATDVRTLTDATGAFALRGPHIPVAKGDDACLVVLASGFATRSRRCLGFRAGRYDAGPIALEPGGFVVGRLVDDAGHALAGIAVEALQFDVHPRLVATDQNSSPYPPLTPFTSPVSDAEGRFCAGPFWPGAARLSVEPPGRLGAWFDDVPVAPGESTDLGDVLLSRGAVVSGVVVDERGEPIADAEVCARSAPPEGEFNVFCQEIVLAQLTYARQGQCVRAAFDGSFVVSGLREGVQLVVAAAPGREPASLAAVEAVSAGLQLRLLPEARLRLTILDATTAQPIEAASVLASRLCFAEGTGSSFTALEVTQDALVPSAFDVHGVGPLRTEVTVSAPRYAARTCDLSGASVGHVLELTLWLVPECVASGRVVSPDGEPLEGVRVSMGSRDDDNRSVHVPASTTDATGAFAFAGLGAGRWSLLASSLDLEPTTMSVVLAEGQAQAIGDVVLRPGAVIEGFVLDAEGRPVAGEMVMASARPHWPNWEYASMATDLEGHFKLRGLSAAEWTLGKAGSARDAIKVLLEPGEHRRIDLSPIAAAVVNGRLLGADGRGVPGMVRAIPLDVPGSPGHGRWVTETADDTGHFTLQLQAGRHAVTALAFAPACGVAEEREFDARPGEVSALDIVLGSARLSGRVTDATTGAALGGVRVSCAGFELAPDTAWPLTSLDGSFTLGNLAAGTHTLTLHIAGHADASIEAVASENPPPLDIALWRGATIRGRVQTAAGTSAPDRTGLFLLRSPAEPFVARVETWAGAFTMADLAPGSYELVVSSSGWTSDGIISGERRAALTVTVVAGEEQDVVLTLGD